MTRRADPERIYIARRVATYRQLVDVYRLDGLDAEHWVARWERVAESHGVGRYSPGFWHEGAAWIMAQTTEPESR